LHFLFLLDCDFINGLWGGRKRRKRGGLGPITSFLWTYFGPSLLAPSVCGWNDVDLNNGGGKRGGEGKKNKPIFDMNLGISVAYNRYCHPCIHMISHTYRGKKKREKEEGWEGEGKMVPGSHSTELTT